MLELLSAAGWPEKALLLCSAEESSLDADELDELVPGSGQSCGQAIMHWSLPTWRISSSPVSQTPLPHWVAGQFGTVIPCLAVQRSKSAWSTTPSKFASPSACVAK